MSENDQAITQAPNIHDKLLHLGFEASAADQTVFSRPDLEGLKIVLNENRINIRHENAKGEALHEAFLHQQAALNNTHLEQHVRGAFCQVFGFEAAKEIKNYPYSEKRVAQYGAPTKLNLP